MQPAYSLTCMLSVYTHGFRGKIGLLRYTAAAESGSGSCNSLEVETSLNIMVRERVECMVKLLGLDQFFYWPTLAGEVDVCVLFRFLHRDLFNFQRVNYVYSILQFLKPIKQKINYNGSSYT